MEYCRICTDTKPSGEFTGGVGCSHRFCTKCTRRYQSTIPSSSPVLCPEPGCASIWLESKSFRGQSSPEAARPPPESRERATCSLWIEHWSSEWKLVRLARRNRWQRCSNCRVFVERTHGCSNMTCLCSHRFCYTCGSSRRSGCTAMCRLKVKLARLWERFVIAARNGDGIISRCFLS